MSPSLTTSRRSVLELELLVPDGIVLQTQIRGLRAADASGHFGLRTGHERFVTILIPGIVVIEDDQGRERFAAVDGGILVLEDNHISVACREAVVAERVEEIADVAAEMLERRRLEEKTSRAEFVDLQFALLRELRKVERKK